MSDKIDTSDEMCALICMVVSNPGLGERKYGWQKRVNDLIRALRDERNALEQQVAGMRAVVQSRMDAAATNWLEGNTDKSGQMLAELEGNAP